MNFTWTGRRRCCFFFFYHKTMILYCFTCFLDEFLCFLTLCFVYKYRKKLSCLLTKQHFFGRFFLNETLWIKVLTNPKKTWNLSHHTFWFWVEKRTHSDYFSIPVVGEISRKSLCCHQMSPNRRESERASERCGWHQSAYDTMYTASLYVRGV